VRTPEHREKQRQNALRLTQSDAWKESIRRYKESGRAKANCAKRKTRPLPHWRTYTSPNGSTHRFRSSWEEILARYFDSLGVSWQFEPKRFKLSCGSSYLPDFLIHTPFGDCFVEAHRIRRVKPDDEDKVDLLHRIVEENLLPHPLILLGEREIIHIRQRLGLSHHFFRRR